jgi:hypothetical protein
LKETRSLPIRSLNLAKTSDRRRHDQLASLVESLLSIQEAELRAKTPQDKEAIRREIEATDRRIDALVYELYGLTEDEIRIVEEATRT